MAAPLPHRREEDEAPAGPPRPRERLRELNAAPPTGAPAPPKPKRLARAITLAIALVIWFIPLPGNLTPQAWHLFAIFAATILSVVIGAFPILTASVLAVAAAVLTRTLTANDAYAGFANPTIVLIIVAFLVARAVRSEEHTSELQSHSDLVCRL